MYFPDIPKVKPGTTVEKCTFKIPIKGSKKKAFKPYASAKKYFYFYLINNSVKSGESLASANWETHNMQYNPDIVTGKFQK